MARASNIYLVAEVDYDGDRVQAAFTVKHECQTWIERNPAGEDDLARAVIRLPDGYTGDIKRGSEAEFLAA